MPRWNSVPSVRVLAANLLLLTMGVTLGAQPVHVRRYDRPLWTSADGFTDPASLRELKDGRVIVTELKDVEIWLVSSTGQRIRQIGRRGGGPQEFQAPMRALPLPGDSTLIVDGDQERFLLLDADAKPVRTVALPKAFLGSGEFARGTDQRGRIYFPLLAGGDNTTAPLLRWDRSTNRVETVATIAVEPTSKPVPMGKVGDMTLTGRFHSPWPNEDAWAVLEDGTVMVIRSPDYRVDLTPPAGGVRKGAPMTYTRVAVSAAERKKYAARLTPEPFKPSFAASEVFVSPDGEVWVGHYGIDSRAIRNWDVLNSQGARIATVELSKDRTLLAVARGKVYLYRTDADGLNWIEAYAR